MPKLSLIEEQARRLARRLSGPWRHALQGALIDLCEARWREIRGPEPATPLARALWAVQPPLADLFMDLLVAGDARLEDLLDGLRPPRALALLVLAEIERGNAEGVRIAHEAMMLSEFPAAGQMYAERISAALHGTLDKPRLHRPSSREPLWNALATITEHTARTDSEALVATIRLLVATPGAMEACPDEALERLSEALRTEGVRFLGIDDSTVHYELHGRRRKVASRNRLRGMLAGIRQAWRT